MKKEIFSLEPNVSSRIVKIIQIIFGILCIGIAIFWIIFNIRSEKADVTLWITTIFLVGFGIYQVLAGAGKTLKYIEISREKIILKQNSVLPHIEMNAADIARTELYPLSITFILKNNKKIIFRFGLNYTEIIDPVKKSITEFSRLNNIPSEFKTEEL
jgi:hypothetical protein